MSIASAKKKQLPPTDPQVKVPTAVRAAAERANQIHEQTYKPDDPDAAAAPEAQAQVPEGVAPPDAVPTPAPDTPQGNSPAPAPAPAPVADDTWQHKFDSMKGRFEREQNINRSLVDRITGLESTIATLSSTSAPPANTTSLITPEEIAEYGPEFLDLVKRRAAEVVSEETKELRRQVTELQQQLGTVGQHVKKDAKARMHDVLNQAVPNWLELNEDEKFLDWLALPDPYSGVIKLDMLKSAYAANDAPRVLNFFKGFLAAEAAKAPRQPETAPVPPAEPKVPLEALAAPGRAKTAAPSPAPVEKPFISRADVTQFYADSAKGLYRGRDEDKALIEAMIHAAARDGRIR